MLSDPPAILEPGWLLRRLQGVDFPHKLGICERLFGRGLAPHGVCWVRTAAGIPWKLDLSSSSHRWIVYGKYEGHAFLNWARRHLPRDGVVVDSGANIGQMLLYLAQWIPAGKLLAVEPGAEPAEWLSACLAANPGLPVELLRIGLGAAEQDKVLVRVGDPAAHGACSQVRDAGAGEHVHIRPLAEVIRERGFDTVHLWKLDVEGFELEALAGAEPLLARRAIRALYCELAFGHGERIRETLARFGYRCHFFDASGRMHEPDRLPEHANGLFLPD